MSCSSDALSLVSHAKIKPPVLLLFRFFRQQAAKLERREEEKSRGMENELAGFDDDDMDFAGYGFLEQHLRKQEFCLCFLLIP